MKKLYAILFLLPALHSKAQVGIGTTTPNSTLDVRGSLSTAVLAFSSNTTAGVSDNLLVFTGNSAATLTLPDATTMPGREYWIKNASTNSSLLTIATSSFQTIDGAGSWPLSQLNKVIRLVSNGTNWYAASESLPGSSSGSGWLLGGNNTGSVQNIGTIGNYAFPFVTNNVERMRITSSGQVGIGTSGFNASYPEKLLVDAGSTGNTNYQNVIVGKGNTNSYAQLNIQNFNTGTSASSDVVATSNNGTETVNYVDMGINGGGNTSTGVLGGANTAYLYSTGNDFSIGNATDGKPLKFFTNNSGNLTEQMRITSTGNIGIGSSSFTDGPNEEKLLIHAGETDSYNLIGAYGDRNGYLQFNIQNLSSMAFASTDIVATADNGTETANYVNLGINSSNYNNGVSSLLNGSNNAYLYSKGEDFVIGNASTSRSMIFFTGGDAPGNEKFRLNSSGMVVKSDLFPSNDNTYLLGKNGARWSAVWSADGIIQTSDQRLKTNIKPLGYGLREVMMMRPVSYDWKNSPGKNHKIGLIAQEVKSLVPEVVVGDETKENLGMNYGELIPVLIRAMQEQQKQIEKLQEEILVLKATKN
jgi:hypothetical protein